ncbi:MAG: NCS2 family permease, partial [Clostridium sp.]
MDFFDTAGTLVAVGSKVGLMKEDGSVLTIILMPLTYSIGEGIAFGFLAYVIIMVFKGDYKKVHPVMYGLGVLFITYF